MSGTHRAQVASAAALAVAASSVAFAQCEGWLAGQAPQGASGTTRLVREWDADGSGPEEPELLIGGALATIAGYESDGVHLWNGSRLRLLGPSQSGLTHLHDAREFQGALVVTGSFQWTSLGSNFKNIARWNGAAWQPLGTGINGETHALEELGETLVAAGYFTSAGGTNASRVARWNGTAWAPLGVGLNNNVHALCLLEDRLYAGGEFTASGTQTVNRIASWDGSAWAPVCSGFDNYVKTLAVYNGELYAGGWFSYSGPNPIGCLARWGGSLPCRHAHRSTPA